MGEVGRQPLDGERRLLERLLHRRAQRGHDGGVHADAGHETEVAVAGQPKVDPGHGAGRQQLDRVRRLERDAELHGQDVHRAGGDDRQRYVRAGQTVDGLIDGAVAADGADEVEPGVHRLAREALGVAGFEGLELLHDVAEATQGIKDQRHVAFVVAAARVRVEDRGEALAGDRHVSASSASAERLMMRAVAGLPRERPRPPRSRSRRRRAGGRPSRTRAGCGGRAPRPAARGPGTPRRRACGGRRC